MCSFWRSGNVMYVLWVIESFRAEQSRCARVCYEYRITKGKHISNRYLVGRVNVVSVVVRLLPALTGLNTDWLMSRATPGAEGTWSVKTDDRSQLNAGAAPRRCSGEPKPSD